METTVWGTGSGMDRVERIREQLDSPEPAPAPYDLLGMRFVRAEKGRVEFTWTPGARVLNRGGVVHGGYVATALDEASGVSAMSMSDPVTPFLTMSLNVDYLRPLLPGQEYTVVGSVLHGGRQRVLSHATITDSLGRLCAQATASMTPNRVLLESRTGSSAPHDQGA